MELYVLVRTLGGIAAALGLVASMVTLIDFVEVSRTLGARVELNFLQLAGLTLLKSPAVILQLLPFVFLFGSMGAFAALNRRSELVAMRAAGASAWRFTLPTAVTAFRARNLHHRGPQSGGVSAERPLRGPPRRTGRRKGWRRRHLAPPGRRP